MPLETILRARRRVFFCAALFLLASAALAQSPSSLAPGEKPADAPPQWKEWIGEYGPDNFIYSVRESQGRLWISSSRGGEWQFLDAPIEKYGQATSANRVPLAAKFHRAADGVLTLITGDVAWSRRNYGVDEHHVARTKPLRPVDELRAEALKATPPVESGSFRKPDLVELASLDPTIHLDIRYATSNDFLGTPVYSQARAFLQRPAAEALLRVQRKLRTLGYGLLVHDAYRPWYVTKIFWDASPPEGKSLSPIPRRVRATTVAVPSISRSMICRPENPLECPEPMMKCRRVRFPIIPAALRFNVGIATSFAAPWSLKASVSMKPNGGTSITRIGRNTRF